MAEGLVAPQQKHLWAAFSQMLIYHLPGSGLALVLGGVVKNPAECPVPSSESQFFVSQHGKQSDGPEKGEQSKGWGLFKPEPRTVSLGRAKEVNSMGAS